MRPVSCRLAGVPLRPHRFRAGRLEQALCARQPFSRSGLIHPSDRGVQYVSIRYTERLAEAGIEPSVGSVGDSYDNALAETINGLYKAEVIHRKSWQALEKVEWATLTWVDGFNHRRLLEPIGYIPPAEAEAAYSMLLWPSRAWMPTRSAPALSRWAAQVGCNLCGLIFFSMSALFSILRR